MAEAMPITPELLTWARERSGYSLAAAAEKFPKIAEWERGAGGPTYPRLEDLAKAFRIPVAVFFFPEPPDLPPIEASFRTLGPAQFARIPPGIRLLLRKARAFQLGLEELNLGRNPARRLITGDLSLRPSDDIDHIAAQVRDYLGISLEQQTKWDSVETALNNWRKAFLRVGVYVFKDQFRNNEYSGFCLYHEEFPIIYVNNTAAKTRQIFTLFHELAHLLFHSSGLDTPEDDHIDDLPPDHRSIELICNRLAARLLLPDAAFDRAFAGELPTQTTATELAQLFKVSRESIYRKFLDRDLITNEEYEAAAQKWTEEWTAKQKGGGGGNYYYTKITYLGPEYIRLAFQRYHQNQIDADQLADYLDTKPKNLPRLEEYFLRSAS